MSASAPFLIKVVNDSPEAIRIEATGIAVQGKLPPVLGILILKGKDINLTFPGIKDGTLKFDMDNQNAINIADALTANNNISSDQKRIGLSLLTAASLQLAIPQVSSPDNILPHLRDANSYNAAHDAFIKTAHEAELPHGIPFSFNPTDDQVQAFTERVKASKAAENAASPLVGKQ